MIDLKARTILAKLLERYSSGEITNFYFEDNIPSSDDLTIHAIYHSVWCFYDDFKEHTASENHAFSDKMKNEFSRWILFLNSDEPYDWPDFPYPGIRPIEHGLMSKLMGSVKKEEKFMRCGEYSVWPFTTRKSFEKAKEKLDGQKS